MEKTVFCTQPLTVRQAIMDNDSTLESTGPFEQSEVRLTVKLWGTGESAAEAIKLLTMHNFQISSATISETRTERFYRPKRAK